MPLLGQELRVVDPYPRHEAHVDEALLVELVDSLVVLCLGDQVKLLHVESRLFEVVEPEFVAPWQVGEGSLVQARAVLEVVDRLCHDGVPPRPEIVDVGYSRRLCTILLLSKHYTYILILAFFVRCHKELLLELRISRLLRILKFCRGPGDRLRLLDLHF